MNTVLSEPELGFEITFNALEDEYKNEAKKLLIYIDRILSQSMSQESNFQYIHIHIERLNERHSQTLATFLVIKLFLLGLLHDQSKVVNNLMTSEIAKIEKALSIFMIPEGVKSHQKAYKDIVANRNKLGEQKLFYTSLQSRNPCASLFPNTILNVLEKDKSFLSTFFSSKTYATTLDELNEKLSYVILNKTSFEKLKKFSFRNSKLLQRIENVLFFNSENRQDLRGFNFSTLKMYNSNYETRFKNLILISTCPYSQSFNSLKHKIETIENRYFGLSKYPNFQTYIVSSTEIKVLDENNIDKSFTAHFAGQQETVLWENFKHILSYYSGLEELVSIKMMNIYSLVFNANLKKKVLEWIFGNGNSILITSSTREILQEDLTEESRIELRNELSNTLDLIIGSNWLNSIKEGLGEDPILIVPSFISKSDKLKRELSALIGISKKRLRSWFEKFKTHSKDILVLDYRDSGRFPFNISPNFYKHNFEECNSINGLFISFFFKNKYDWNRYRYNSELIKMHRHPLKELFFNWSQLEDSNKRLKPSFKEVIYRWDDENTYQEKYDSINIKVDFFGKRRTATYHAAELFIYSFGKDNSDYKVARIDEIIEFDKEFIQIQKLEEFYDTLNLAERIVNTSTHEKELEIIRNKYNLENSDSTELLWKTLLVEKNEKNEDLYDILNQFFRSRNLNLVSRNTFVDAWLNFETGNFIPRGKKNFLALCDFLELPKVYYLIMRRKKNSGKSNERLRTSINNKMFGLLFNDGCFDDSNHANKIITRNLNRYKAEIDFEDLGIAQDDIIIQELKSLVELLVDTIKLERLKDIQTVDND